MSGGVGGLTGAIPSARPDQGCVGTSKPLTPTLSQRERELKAGGLNAYIEDQLSHNYSG